MRFPLVLSLILLSIVTGLGSPIADQQESWLKARRFLRSASDAEDGVASPTSELSLDELKEQFENGEKGLEMLQEAINNATGEVAKQEGLTAAAKKNYNEKKEIFDKLNEKKKAKDKAEQAEIDYKEAENQLEIAKNASIDAEAALKATRKAKERKEEAEGDKTTNDAKIKQLSDDLVELVKKKDEANQALVTLDADIADFTSRLASCTNNCEPIKQALEKDKGRRDGVEAAFTTAESAWSTAAGQLEKCKEKEAQLKEEFAIALLDENKLEQAINTAKENEKAADANLLLKKGARDEAVAAAPQEDVDPAKVKEARLDVRIAESTKEENEKAEGKLKNNLKALEETFATEEDRVRALKQEIELRKNKEKPGTGALTTILIAVFSALLILVIIAIVIGKFVIWPKLKKKQEEKEETAKDAAGVPSGGDASVVAEQNTPSVPAGTQSTETPLTSSAPRDKITVAPVPTESAASTLPIVIETATKGFKGNFPVQIIDDPDPLQFGKLCHPTLLPRPDRRSRMIIFFCDPDTPVRLYKRAAIFSQRKATFHLIGMLRMFDHSGSFSYVDEASKWPVFYLDATVTAKQSFPFHADLMKISFKKWTFVSDMNRIFITQEQNRDSKEVVRAKQLRTFKRMKKPGGGANRLGAGRGVEEYSILERPSEGRELSGSDAEPESVILIPKEPRPNLEELEKEFDGLMKNIDKPVDVKDVLRNIRVALSSSREKYKFDINELVCVLSKAKDVFKRKKSQVVTKTGIYPKVFGDLHGCFDNLEHTLKMYEEFEKMDGGQDFIYLGDYVDRGSRSTELIITLFCMKILNPEKVTLLRGNHESQAASRVYGFKDDLIELLGEEDGPKFHDYFSLVFSYMPLCCKMDRVFFMHGGLPDPALIPKGIDSLNEIPKFLWDFHDNPIALALGWSDPLHGYKGLRTSTRGDLITDFGMDIADKVGEILGVDIFVRGHKMIPNGYDKIVGKHTILVTLFGLTSYNILQPLQTRAAVMVFHKGNKISFDIIAPGTSVEDGRDVKKNHNRENGTCWLTHKPFLQPEPDELMWGDNEREWPYKKGEQQY